ncbi:hypothetical protein NDU88_001269 [Pleurodeles waltl]|uniref:Uncharacterized protein n=1 Tax=Pleurodeles waltl TaxID=8319 RepID=A0AAV7P382_PLEWA|nr:hypothetical protein NDU88_001269 [Pleurodeles waltl]
MMLTAMRKNEEEPHLQLPNCFYHYINPAFVEQRVSDLEDVQTLYSTTMDKMQAELQELQRKLGDYENRSRRSNLRFIGIPEELEATSSVTKVISDLIYKCVLPEKATGITANVVLSIMRAHRVSVTRIPSAKYPQTILVNSGDYRIKDQVLLQAIRAKVFNTTDNFSFRAFSDMSATAVCRRREFISLIDEFKKYGAPEGIVQLAKLKIFHNGRAHIFQNV